MQRQDELTDCEGAAPERRRLSAAGCPVIPVCLLLQFTKLLQQEAPLLQCTFCCSAVCRARHSRGASDSKLSCNT